ncbi:MAG: ATP-binding protein [Bacteroides sp.]
MYENERLTHLLILLVYTFMTIALIGESLLMEWDTGAVVLMFIGLVVSWGFHITEKVPASGRIWIYFTFSMLSCFFYGIHWTSVFDFAPLMIVMIILYSFTEMNRFIWICVATYIVTLVYDFMFVMEGKMNFTSLEISRIMLHVGLVCLAGYLAKTMLQIRNRERKHTENRIAGLEEANRRTEDFLANVSHELRTPINAVTGITSVMIKNENDDAKKRDILSIQKAGYRLFDQIEDILDYTEIDTERVKVSENAYIFTSLINDIITGKRISDKENMPELIFDIDAGVPAVLIGDEKKIKRILKHLIDNALKFTRQGGIYVRVYAMHKEYGINLCIKVSDTGIGISEEELGKIKERFYQSSGGRNRKAGGLGLGLSIVCGMVSAMEGFIQIESTVGEGTTVSVSIPQKVEDASPAMSVKNRNKLCLACYLRPEKYKIPEVRSFYNQMISNLVRELELSLYRIYNNDELKKFMSMYQVTHLFLGKEEYEENKEYIENLNHDINVVVVAEDNFVLPQGSSAKLIKKPFYALPIVNILNSGTSDAKSDERKSMICPGVKVLVVDDEPMNLIVARGIFNGYGMKVTTAESGRKAITLCESGDYDLIFLDHMMPEMDGIETLKQIRKVHTEKGRVCTVIAFTANAVSGAREMFLKEGFDEFLSKPVEPSELERVLRKVLPESSVEYVDEDDKNAGKADVSEKEKGQQCTDEDKKSAANDAEDGAESDKEADSGMERLERAGINTGSGIGYCNGDSDFYIELLTSFVNGAEHKETELEQFFEKKDLDNYCVLVHALKSTAKMIGADFLSENAKQAEDAAKNHELEYIIQHHGELMTLYRQVVQSICDVLGISGTRQNQDEVKERQEISGEEFINQLKDLKDSLDFFLEEKALSIISVMRGEIYPEVPMDEFLDDIRHDVDDYEFVAASKKVAALISQVEGGEF